MAQSAAVPSNIQVELRVVGAVEGPDGGSVLTNALFIQRVNTSGGGAPSTGCGRTPEIGVRALVPYPADYVFYKPSVQ